MRQGRMSINRDKRDLYDAASLLTNCIVEQCGVSDQWHCLSHWGGCLSPLLIEFASIEVGGCNNSWEPPRPRGMPDRFTKLGSSEVRNSKFSKNLKLESYRNLNLKLTNWKFTLKFLICFVFWKVSIFDLSVC